MIPEQVNKPKSWYRTWFDSPYYNILYQNRDEEEAFEFISTLVDHLDPPGNSRILDLACGQGRHSFFLSKMGFDVVGVDLSRLQISRAKKNEGENLHFFRHDMREKLEVPKFDYIFNFFTSFGYFKEEDDNYKTIANISAALKENGVFVIDFMNVDHVLDNMVPESEYHLDGIDFKISRYLEEGFIKKDIRITDGNEKFHFSERVRVLRLDDFKKYLEPYGLRIDEVFGDYRLSPFDPSSSDRLITIARKDA